MDSIKDVAGIAGDLGSLVSGAGSFFGGKQQQQASAAMSEAQMAFQERMSNTAHQREVADLRAAGLNPILSSKFGGASTPTGSVGQAVDFIGNAARNFSSTALQMKQLNSQLELNEAEIELKKAATARELETAANVRADTSLKTENTLNTIEQRGQIGAQTDLLRSQRGKTDVDTFVSQAQISNLMASTDLSRQQIVHLASSTGLNYQQIKKLAVDMDLSFEQIKKIGTERENIKAHTLLTGAQMEGVSQETRNARIREILMKYGESSAAASHAAAQSDLEFYNSAWGKAMRVLGLTGKNANPFTDTSATALDLMRR